MSKHPTPPTLTPDENGNQANGKKLGYKIVNTIFDGMQANWGKIASFGLGIVLTIWLMQVIIIPTSLMVMESYKANDEVQRETSRGNAESIKSIATSMNSMAVNDEKRTAATVEMRAFQKEALTEQQRYQAQVAEVLQKNTAVTKQWQDNSLRLITSVAAAVQEAATKSSEERKHFWEPALESAKRQEQIQSKLLEESKRRADCEENHAKKADEALKRLEKK